MASTRRPPGAAAECVGRDGAMRLRGGFKSNTDRWRECGYNLQPDFRSTANQEVPLNTKLGDAAECGDPDAIKELLQAGADVHHVDWGGFSALHRAAFDGQVEAATVLLDAGAKVNHQDVVGGRTPLHQAAGQGHTKMCDLLIQRGADAHIKDYPCKPEVDDVPGLREAINEMPACAVGAGEDKIWTYPGWTALEHAEDEGHDSTADLLRPWTNEY